MARSVMLQGTSSHVGKSVLAAALCRILGDRGLKVAPFKAQNMALNSFITREGGEIGRAQALQAEAAGVEPSVDMNPILLKATGEAGCQVIKHGRVHANMGARAYYAYKDEAWAAVTESFDRLSKKHDLIVIEGAGSPAEINLSKDEVVNMSIARYAHASVILVGDIDKGGVFASLYGTIALLDGDADYIKAFIINKFRGDMTILEPGLDMIREKTGRPVLGVIPYLGDLGLHEEDGIPLERIDQFKRFNQFKPIKIVVLRLRSISNFTDFDPFIYEPDVELIYSLRPEDIENADAVIIPGSKNTVNDLLFLREHGVAESVKRAVEKGVMVIGICGGYQMLGKKLFDPCGIESAHKEVEGLGLLDVETVFEGTKVTSQVEAVAVWSAECGIRNAEWKDKEMLRGYEIHMGRTTGDIGLFSIRRISHHSARSLPTKDFIGGAPNSELVPDGSMKGQAWGTYIHGIFDNDRFRSSLINALRVKRGLEPVEKVVDYTKVRDEALDKWTKVLSTHVDIEYIAKLLKV